MPGRDGRAGLEKPFHRKRKASIALSFQKELCGRVLFRYVELPDTPPSLAHLDYALGGAWITPSRERAFKY